MRDFTNLNRIDKPIGQISDEPLKFFVNTGMGWNLDCGGNIDPLHKSHNAPGPYPTVHHFATEMCTFLLQNGALWDICPMHCGICEMGLWLHNVPF